MADTDQQIDVQIETPKPERLQYLQFYWIFFIAFPFMMQGFKPEEISQNAPIFLPIEAQLVIGDKAIQLEVARTPTTIARGLTFREADRMPNDRGIMYESNFNTNSSFTGKGNKFTTDLLFLQGNRIVYISQVQPCNESKCLEYRTNQAYDRVIEVKAGSASKVGITAGSVVEIKFIPRH
jgi:uncharacterized protein